MNAVKGKLVLLLLLVVVWIGLTYPLNSQELIAGGLVALLVALMPLANAKLFGEVHITPKGLLYGAAYATLFFAELIKANLDVAFRVLSPRLPINPGIVRVRTSLQSRLGRLLLANSITLTPGTITVEARGSDFYIHWINVQTEDADAATRRIVAKFERYLEVFCG